LLLIVGAAILVVAFVMALPIVPERTQQLPPLANALLFLAAILLLLSLPAWRRSNFRIAYDCNRYPSGWRVS
jgi:hypothetical protein